MICDCSSIRSDVPQIGPSDYSAISNDLIVHHEVDLIDNIMQRCCSAFFFNFFILPTRRVHSLNGSRNNDQRCNSFQMIDCSVVLLMVIALIYDNIYIYFFEYVV